MANSQGTLFIRLGFPDEDECYRAGYSAFLALEDAGVPAATMTLTGASAVVRASDSRPLTCGYYRASWTIGPSARLLARSRDGLALHR